MNSKIAAFFTTLASPDAHPDPRNLKLREVLWLVVGHSVGDGHPRKGLCLPGLASAVSQLVSHPQGRNGHWASLGFAGQLPELPCPASPLPSTGDSAKVT